MIYSFSWVMVQIEDYWYLLLRLAAKSLLLRLAAKSCQSHLTHSSFLPVSIWHYLCLWYCHLNSTEADSYGQAASNLVAGSNLEATIQSILEMGGGTWDRDTVLRALRAAFNNPERAVEYLYSVRMILFLPPLQTTWYSLTCALRIP
jgi:hypothetical protein